MNGPGAEEISDVVDFADAEIEEPPIYEPTFYKKSEKRSAAFDWLENENNIMLKGTTHKLM